MMTIHFQWKNMMIPLRLRPSVPPSNKNGAKMATAKRQVDGCGEISSPNKNGKVKSY